MTTPTVRLEWAFDLPAAPMLVWPLVSDTNQMNMLAGMAPVAYERVSGPDGEPRRIGRGRLGPLRVSWDEHAFSWEMPERFAVRRDFHGGPLRGYTSTVTLSPSATGTRLVHLVELEPRARWLGPLVALAAGREAAGWRRAYGRVAAFLDGALPAAYELPDPEALRPGWDPRLAASLLAACDEHLKAAGLPSLWVERLIALVAVGEEPDVQYIRPFVLAERWRVDRQAVLALCLEATRVGLLQPRWSHLCPRCRGPKGSVARLAELAAEASCDDCGVRFSGTFDRSIELAFRPDPTMRRVQDLVYCIAGPGATPHVLFQGEIAPGTTRRVKLRVEPGVYRVRRPRRDADAHLVYLGEAGSPGPVPTIEVSSAKPAPELRLVGPELVVELHNAGDRPIPMLLEREAWSDQTVTVAHVAALTAYHAALGIDGAPPIAAGSA